MISYHIISYYITLYYIILGHYMLLHYIILYYIVLVILSSVGPDHGGVQRGPRPLPDAGPAMS